MRFLNLAQPSGNGAAFRRSQLFRSSFFVMAFSEWEGLQNGRNLLDLWCPQSRQPR
jgi:hypothetical protein